MNYIYDGFEKEADRIAGNYKESTNPIQDMSKDYQTDLRDVRIHRTAREQKPSFSNTYAKGNEIFIGSTLRNSKEILTHELAHILQNRGKTKTGKDSSSETSEMKHFAPTEKQIKHTIDELTRQINELGPGLMEYMEGLGGHAQDRHAYMSVADVRDRARGIGSATRFLDAKTQNVEAREALLKRQNMAQIAEWLLTQDASDRLVLNTKHTTPIGGGFRKGRDKGLKNTLSSTLVLEKAPASVLGFRIVTFYPSYND